MKLYIGGAFQGQEELARWENPNSTIVANFHEVVRGWLSEDLDPQEQTRQLCEANPDAVIVSDEVGSGVVPMGAENRLWREQVGRAQCLIAERAECVIRVISGIGVRIK